MRKTWGIGERVFKDNFTRRMWLFNHLVLGAVLYGAEIWGWKERIELEKIQRKFIKWSLRLDSCTPDYILYKETDVEKISARAGYRAIAFEEKAVKGGEKKLVIECIKEKEKDGIGSEVGIDKELFLRRNGYSSEGINDLRERDVNIAAILRGKEKERLGQWMDGKIMATRYNTRYKMLTTFGIPRYLREKGTKGSQSMIARWRCGNEEEGNKFWLKDKSCRICRKEIGNLEHITSHVDRKERVTMKELLGEEGGKDALE